MRILVVLGTRPEIIKMGPIIQLARQRGVAIEVLHTGQHYSYELDLAMFEALQLPPPDHQLNVGSGPHGAQTAKMLTGIEAILQEQPPDWVLVQGDTNSVLAGTLAASKLGIPIGHVEAGLRSGDRTMPEEQNRIVADHLGQLLFAPTEQAAACIAREGIPEERIRVTGNTVVDAVHQNRERAAALSTALDRFQLVPQEYVLLTAHRQENVDDPKRFSGILSGAAAVGRMLEVPVIYPIHPRARGRLQAKGLDASGIQLVEPVGYLDFLHLEQNAKIILTDSGGVQEEACILGVPCVTLRDNTERPETVDVGANLLAGTTPSQIVSQAQSQLKAPTTWPCPFGDGHASKRILEALQ